MAFAPPRPSSHRSAPELHRAHGRNSRATLVPHSNDFSEDRKHRRAPSRSKLRIEAMQLRREGLIDLRGPASEHALSRRPSTYASAPYLNSPGSSHAPSHLFNSATAQRPPACGRSTASASVAGPGEYETQLAWVHDPWRKHSAFRSETPRLVTPRTYTADIGNLISPSDDRRAVAAACPGSRGVAWKNFSARQESLPKGPPPPQPNDHKPAATVTVSSQHVYHHSSSQEQLKVAVPPHFNAFLLILCVHALACLRPDRFIAHACPHHALRTASPQRPFAPATLGQSPESLAAAQEATSGFSACSG